MAGPNQTGAALTNPISSALGYSPALQSQADDAANERRKKAMQDSIASAGAGTDAGLVSSMFAGS